MLETTDTPLWAVHVLGPDDLHAATSHADALALCDELNALGLQNNAGKTPGDLRYVIHIAYPMPWPLSPEAHAESLALRRKDEAEWAARKAAYEAKVNSTGAPGADQLVKTYVIPEGFKSVAPGVDLPYSEAALLAMDTIPYGHLYSAFRGALNVFSEAGNSEKTAQYLYNSMLNLLSAVDWHKHLKTEAEVRAEAQREALEKAEKIAVKQAQACFDEPCESGQVDPSTGQFECGLKDCLCFVRHETAQAIAAGLGALIKDATNG